jgi:hypothetical protein
MQDRFLRPPPLVLDRVRRRGAQHGFAFQSHADENARTTIARHRDLGSAEKRESTSTTDRARAAWSAHDRPSACRKPAATAWIQPVLSDIVVRRIRPPE